MLGLGAVEEVLLIGRALIGVARRHGDALDAEALHVVKKLGDTRRIGVVEQSAIDGNAEALRLGELRAATARS